MKLNGQYLTSVRYLVICGGGVLAFVALGIVPNQMAMNKFDNTIASLKAQLAEQESLFPIYNEMMSKVQKIPKASLSMPAREVLAKGDTERPTRDFMDLAARNGLRLNGLTPDIGNLINGKDSLRFKASVSGGFNDFQPFLMEVGKLGYLDTIETVRISALDNAKELFVQFTVGQKN